MLWKKALLARHALQARLGSGAKLENPSRGKVGMRGSNLARTEKRLHSMGLSGYFVKKPKQTVNLLMPLLRENLRIRAQKLQSAFYKAFLYKAFLMIQAPLALPHRHALLASFLCLRQGFCRK